MGIGIGVSKMNGFAGENVCVAGLLRPAMGPAGCSSPGDVADLSSYGPVQIQTLNHTEKMKGHPLESNFL